MTGKRPFNKRIYTVAGYRQAIYEMFDHLDELRAAARSGRVSKPFAERIMLAVTQVNGCRYCHYGHARAALKAGVTPAEIESLVAGEFDQLPPEELVALLFAQHYAESAGRPDPEAWQKVVDTYGPAGAQDIMAYIRMITMGNLMGNTLDAFLSRLKLNPAGNSSLAQELGVILGSVVFIPAGLLRHKLA